MPDYNGLLNIYKPKGMTSHDVVFKLRKLLHMKKIGHAGTLDPDVDGVLPIAVGNGTRVLEFMNEAGKVYEGEVTIGFSTETEDASGAVLERTPVFEVLDELVVDQVMSEFVGEITQIPPMYSAVKVNGRRLYDYARKGEAVERPARLVTITEFVRTSPITYNDGLARFTFRVACSKGTYVRTLAVDLGSKLGFASHMSQLRRTASSGMSLSEAHTLEEIAMLVDEDKLASILLDITYGIASLPQVFLDDHEKTELGFGRFIKLKHETSPLLAALYQDQLFAILERRDSQYKPKKVFNL